MSEFKEYEEKEKTLGVTMADYQKTVMEMTGLDPRGGQIGPIEIYKVARKAAEDLLKERESKIIT